VVVTVELSVKPNAIPTRAFLFGSSLGISKNEALSGDVIGNKAIFEIKVKSSMAGKKFPITVFASNDRGDSPPISGAISVPSLPKPIAIPKVTKKPEAPKTIICVRTNQTRTFAGTACPPGWKSK
jgi:hypothetical protein